MCQSSTGNGKSIKQREREQRAGWFSEETTGQLFDTTLFNTVWLTAEMPQKKNFIYIAMMRLIFAQWYFIDKIPQGGSEVKVSYRPAG